MPVYDETLNKATVKITPKNFAVEQNGDITNKAVTYVIKDNKGADLTTKFTVTKADLTKNDVPAEQSIQNNGADAGEYTATFTAGGESVDVKFTVEKAPIASGSLPSYAIGGSVANTTPVAGNRLSNVTGAITAATDTTAEYVWTVNDTAVAKDTIVASGDKLVLKVTLTAKDNYAFADPFTASVTGIGDSNNFAGTVTRVDGDTLTITYAEMTVG